MINMCILNYISWECVFNGEQAQGVVLRCSVPKHFNNILGNRLANVCIKHKYLKLRDSFL